MRLTWPPAPCRPLQEERHRPITRPASSDGDGIKRSPHANQKRVCESVAIANKRAMAGEGGGNVTAADEVRIRQLTATPGRHTLLDAT